MRLIRIAWWALSLALLDLSTARVSLVVSSETVKSKAPHWAATLGDAVAGVDHVAGSERTSPHDKVTTLTMTAQSSLDVPVSTTRSDLPWDVVRKRVEQLPPASADVPLELMRLLVDDADFFSAFDDGVVLVNASIDLCIGDVARWNRESCPSPGVHATVCVAHRDGDDVEKASFSKREVDARRRVAQFGKKAASLFSVWPLEFLEDDADDFVSDHLVSRECRPGAKDVSCGATPLYRRMVTSVLSPPLQQRKYRSFDALGADEGRSLGRSHGHPSRPFCFVSTSLNPFNLCTDTLHRILKLMYARVFIQAQVDDDLNLGAEGAQDGDATNELVDLADFLMAVKSQVVVPRPLGSHQHHFPKSAADISIQRHRHALRFSPQLSKATDAATRIAEFFRSEADGVHASVQLHRSQRLHKEASVSFVSQVNLATFFTPENPVASPMLAMPHATQASESGDSPMRVDGLVELRGESHGRLRIRLVLNADPFDASESRVGAVDVVIRWPRLLYKPHLRSVRLVRVRGAEGTALEEDFMFNETSARIRSRTWGNLTSWAHPCFSNPILIGAITDVSLIEHIFRVGLVNSLACHNVLLRSNGTWSVDALIDFDFQHLHADEYAPDMNRYYGMPPIIARLRGERQFLSRSGRPRPVAEWATLLSPWIDSHVANVAESGAISPFETDELVKHLLATYVNRDWQLETWAISTDAGLYVNPPIPDRAMPFNALALWATVLALTVMTVLKVAVRSSAMELWGNDFDTDFKTTVSRETE